MSTTFASTKVVSIDLSAVQTTADLHTALGNALGFPDFYGRNWDAFWDAITGLVAMPDRLRLVGWDRLVTRLPEDAGQLRIGLDQLADEPGAKAIQVDYVDEVIAAPDAPALPGLVFRHFRGPADYPGMVAVLVASAAADGEQRADTVDELATGYSRLTNCDPFSDMILAEVNGALVGYARGSWRDDAQAGRIYESVGFLAPAWRRRGIGGVMLAWIEERLRRIAAGHPADQAACFQASATAAAVGATQLLLRAGYQPARYFDEMVRTLEDELPEVPIPDGFALRPVEPAHYPLIWAQIHEDGEEEWGYQPPSADDYEAWLEDPVKFQPPLWQVAWDHFTGACAGHLLCFIDHGENARLDRRRGYTEGLGVGAAWRRRGLARALLAHGLAALRDAGMVEAALNADRDNASGAVGLYESLGYRLEQRDAVYRKPLGVARRPSS